MQKKWNEHNFFDKAICVRKKILASSSQTQEIELSILSQLVEQEFKAGKIPQTLYFSPSIYCSDKDFSILVKKVLKQVGICNNYSFIRRNISSGTTNIKYMYMS